MDNHIIHRHTVGIVALHITTPRIPDLDRTIFRRSNQPFGLAVKRDARDIGRVTVEGEDRIWVRGLDVVELDGVVTGGGEVALVGRYT
jgi:hypothetical protein